MATTIGLKAYRLDGGSGVCTTTNGILLPEGALASSDVSAVALWVNGAEVSCYVEALSGTHGDGSRIALLLQASLGPASVVTAELRIGTAAAQSRLTKTAVPAPYGAACLLPNTASDWLTNTVLLSAPSRAATPAEFTAFDTNWDGWEAIRRAGASPYAQKWDRAHAYFGQIARAPTHANVAEWYKVACHVAHDYVVALASSYATNNYANNPGQSTIAFGVAWFYWLSGYEAARTAAGYEAVNQLGLSTNPQWLYPDGRVNHWAMLSAALCALMESPGDDPVNARGPYTRAQYVTGIEHLIDTAIAEQIPANGSAVGAIAAAQGGVAGIDSGGVSNEGFWFYDPNGTDKVQNTTAVIYYMAGMIAMGMIYACELLPEVNTAKRAAVLASAKTMCDQWIAAGTSLWDAASQQAKYESEAPWPPPSTGGVWFVDVNPWIAQVMAWVYAQTGDSTYLTWGDTLFSGMVSRIGTPGSGTYGQYNNGGGNGNLTADEQAFNQYGVAWPYLGLRTLATGTATQLLLSTQPAGAVSGVALTTQPSGTVADSTGTTVTSDTSTITAAWVPVSGDAEASGTLSTVASAGGWAFTDLALTWTVPSQGRWRFSRAGLPDVDSDLITLSVSVPGSGARRLRGVSFPVLGRR